MKQGIIKLANEFNNLEDYNDNNCDWLDKLNSTQAYLACIGAGPWKVQRRIKVQTNAIKNINNQDLSCLEQNNINILGFPFDWQKEKY